MRPSDVLRGDEGPHVHAVPTAESIAAVASFERDVNPHVRIAVARALGQQFVPERGAARVLARMLRDAHPCVRINAALALRRRARMALSPDMLSAALSDETWTVRWIIARSLARTDLADRGWRVLRSTRPSHVSSLLYWFDYCFSYADRFVSDAVLMQDVQTQIESIPEGDSWRRAFVASLQHLVELSRPPGGAARD